MKRILVVVALVGLIVSVGMLLPGCSGSDDNPLPLDIVGTWRITAAGYEGIVPPMVVTITAHLGPNTVTATATGGNGYVTGVTVVTQGMPLVEEPRGITITTTFNDGAWSSFGGSVDDDNRGMSGNYTNSQGFTGSWEAARI